LEPTKIHVYISGRITGKKNYREVFFSAAQFLRDKGYFVFNPAEHREGLKWEEYMELDIPEVCQCDEVYVLPGWKKSRGARLEVKIARALKKPVFSYKTGERLF
jgi:Domain of unknown function (DUF4406)